MASGAGDRAAVTIVDDGPGIPPEDQAQVFARFHRSGVRGEAALGLGLPPPRQFVEAHGGEVELESALGKGTSVTLNIPRAPQCGPRTKRRCVPSADGLLPYC